MSATKINPDSLYAQALQAHTEGKLDEARRGYQAVLSTEPDHWQTLQALGVLLFQHGTFSEGILRLEQASRIAPDEAEIWSNLGNCYRTVNRPADSVEACKKAIALNPGLVQAWSNLSASLRVLDDIGGSIEAARESLRLDPGFAEGLMNLGIGLLAAGLQEEAIDSLRQAAESNPQNLSIWDNLLFASTYSGSWSIAEVQQLHEMYGRMFVLKDRPTLPPKCETIGFISGDFRNHPVGEFLAPLLKGLRQFDYRIILYCNQAEFDGTSELLLGLASTNHKVNFWSDLRLINQIKADKIDLLVDLSGHSASNRLPVFIQRPAPVQATYLGYSCTTGVPAIDFFIANNDLVPEPLEPYYTERVIKLSQSPFTRPGSPASRARKGEVPPTFACFNNPSKITEACLAAWSNILKRLPESTLVLKYPAYDAPWIASEFRERFVRQGVHPSRVKILGFVPRNEHLEWLSQVDIALDTFPYNGATTTLDALVAGLPVVTLTGENYSSRMSASLLRPLGLGSLEAGTVDEYIDVAVRLGSDHWEVMRLSDLIVENWEDSGLGDGEELAEAFHVAIQEMWRATL